MTNQEAIETIKVAISEVEWNYPMEYAVAFEKAAEAVEKQIPKAPIAEIRKVDTVIGNGTWKAGTTVHKCLFAVLG